MTLDLDKFAEIEGILKILEFIQNFIEYLDIAYEQEDSYEDIDTECHSFDSGVYDTSVSESEDLNI